MDLFKLEPGLAIWTWISFGLLFFIMAKFIVPAILKNLETREDYIRSAVDKTAEVEKRLREIESERSVILKNAEKEADELLLRVRKDAELLHRKLTEQAEADAREIMEQSRETAVLERQAALKQLQQDLADFVCDASEKVVGLSFITEREREFTARLVKEL